MNEPYKYWVTIPTRWRDMDAVGHVNSATYLTYFEIARMDYFDSVGLTKLKVPGKVGPAVVSQTCNYREQVFHPAELHVGVRTSAIGRTSFTVEYRFFLKDTDRVVCDGHTIMVWLDYEHVTPIPVPEPLKQGIFAIEGREF